MTNKTKNVEGYSSYKPMRHYPGQAGHFIANRHCAFKMYDEGSKYRVSTVGEYSHMGSPWQSLTGLSNDAFYETMVFDITSEDRWRDIECLRTKTKEQTLENHELLVAKYTYLEGESWVFNALVLANNVELTEYKELNNLLYMAVLEHYHQDGSSPISIGEVEWAKQLVFGHGVKETKHLKILMGKIHRMVESGKFKITSFTNFTKVLLLLFHIPELSNWRMLYFSYTTESFVLKHNIFNGNTMDIVSIYVGERNYDDFSPFTLNVVRNGITSIRFAHSPIDLADRLEELAILDIPSL